jgi:glutamate-1-semialdehyde aminotransferase
MIAGFTSTGSKHPRELFGVQDGVPCRMVRSEGCRLWGTDGREYIDFIMALGAVSLGYAHPVVTEAVERAVRDGGVGSLAPALEQRVAERLCAAVPGAQAVRFLKSGTEAVAAAVRLARVHTHREAIVTCGYQGWLDTFSTAPGVPQAVMANRTPIPFNDIDALEVALGPGTDVAAVVIEPVVDGPPAADWVRAVNQSTRAHGAVLVLDEIKTCMRLGPGGGAARYGFEPDMIVLGKALGNGFPCAAVCGTSSVMSGVEQTWISSTLATEFVSLAAADAVLDVYDSEDIARHLSWVGGSWYIGLEEVAASAPRIIEGVRGIPEFSYLQFVDDDTGCRVARRCAEYGMLFKRNAYNFVSAAHTPEVVKESLTCLGSVVEEVAYG